MAISNIVYPILMATVIILAVKVQLVIKKDV